MVRLFLIHCKAETPEPLRGNVASYVRFGS